ncbi:hypothetical protein [Nioella nitratireducens]|uniref:hypothetical protein n=1 Tax=Nioella nitratireducens TaxID=1287720 RepID=UPI0008FD7F74|nr:hypothetical protein [Nioella nitratireducens]
METILAIAIFLAIPVGIFLTHRRKIGTLRNTVDMAMDLGQELAGRGTRLSGLIRQHSDPVESIVEPRMATVGLAALVLAQDGDFPNGGKTELRDAIMDHYRTGEAQAGDMVLLCDWLVGKLGNSGTAIDRLAARSQALGADDPATAVDTLVTRAATACGVRSNSALDRALAAIA